MDTPAGTVTKPDERKDEVPSTTKGIAEMKLNGSGESKAPADGTNEEAKPEGSYSKPLGSYPKTGIDVLVVGTGLAGLTAAIECTRKGHNVRVLERNSTINTAGDMYFMGLSATK